MEKRGQVNCYEPYNWFDGIGSEIYTVNLTNGVTPMMNIFDGKQYSSLCYFLRRPFHIDVRKAWYRPSKGDFLAYDIQTQDHILKGGMLCKDLAVAVLKQLQCDPVLSEWDYEIFQGWCLSFYGRRLPPLDS